MLRRISAVERGVKFWIASWLTCDTEIELRKRERSPLVAVTTMSSLDAPASGVAPSWVAGVGAWAVCAKAGALTSAIAKAAIDPQDRRTLVVITLS
jgi:hypothetical protein